MSIPTTARCLGTVPTRSPVSLVPFHLQHKQQDRRGRLPLTDDASHVSVRTLACDGPAIRAGLGFPTALSVWEREPPHLSGPRHTPDERAVRGWRPKPAPRSPQRPTGTTAANLRSEAGDPLPTRQVRGHPRLLLSRGQDTGLQNKHNLGFTSEAEVPLRQNPCSPEMPTS